MSDLRFNKDRLIELMEQQRMGDTQLAKLVGVSRQMIFYLRKGKRQTAAAELITKIAEALGTTVEYLLGDDQARSIQPQPQAIRQLAEVAARLSEIRQEELIRIAAALEKLEREQTERPLPGGMMGELIRVAELLRDRGGNDDLLVRLEALLRGEPPVLLTDLDGGQSPHDPDKGG